MRYKQGGSRASPVKIAVSQPHGLPGPQNSASRLNRTHSTAGAIEREHLLNRLAHFRTILPAFAAEVASARLALRLMGALMRIELLYFDGCPDHAELRARVPRLLEQAGVDATIEEHRIDSEHAACRERFLSSPTLRIDGHDIDPGAAGRHDYGLRCRLYPTENGLQRTPPDDCITNALQAAHSTQTPLT